MASGIWPIQRILIRILMPPLASVTANNGSTDNNNNQFLRAKKRLKAGIWNCRFGIDSAVNFDTVLKAAQDHSLDILSIPEAAKSGYGKQEVAAGYVLYWTGPPQPQRRLNRGVALFA